MATGVVKDRSPKELANILQRLILKLRKAQANLKDTFRYFDENKDHVIDIEDFKMLLLHYGYSLTENDVRRMFKYFDIEENDLISFQEFVAVVNEEDYPENHTHKVIRA